MKGFNEVKSQYLKRAERKEFPASKYIVYLNSSLIVAQDVKLLHTLTQYGLDSLYEKLAWHDKAQILDIANRTEAPYVKKAFNRVIIDLLLTPYDKLISEINTETLIQITAHI